MEETIVTSYNYSGTCTIYWRIENFIFVPRQATRKKVIQNKPIFSVKFSPDLGKLPRFQENLKYFCFSPRSGEISLLWGKILFSDFIGVINESGRPMQGVLTPSLVLEKSLSENIYTDKFDRWSLAINIFRVHSKLKKS